MILHLAAIGRIGPDDLGLPGNTQRGMSEALGVRQGNLTKILSRLESAELVEVHRRHVRGEPRRLKVYRLTGLGESVARDLRHRTGAGSPHPAAPEPAPAPGVPADKP